MSSFAVRFLFFLLIIPVTGIKGLAAPPTVKTPTPATSPKTPAAQEESLDQLKQQAGQAREKGDIPLALQLYQKLAKRQPDWVEGWWYLGSLSYEADQYAQAAAALKKVARADPRNSQAWGLLGLCEFQLKQNAQALEHLTKARQLGLDQIPEFSRVARLHQAILLCRSRQFEAALFVLNTFAWEHQQANSVLDTMGLAVLRIPLPLDSLSPEQREMIRGFGQAAFLEGEQKSQEALKAYEELETRYRGRPNVAYAMGSTWLTHRDPEKAISFFKQELEKDPTHEAALVQMALQMIVLGRFEEGIPYAQKVIALFPQNFAGYYSLGRIQLYLNHLAEAIPLLEKAVMIAPTIATLHYTLAQAYQRNHQEEKALQARTQFEKLQALNKDRRTDLFITMDDLSSPGDKGEKSTIPH
jgi:tetratricopeptide (TPR) repeat protein